MSRTFTVLPQRSGGGGGVANPMTSGLNAGGNAISGITSLVSSLGSAYSIVPSPAPSNVNWSAIANAPGNGGALASNSGFWACVRGGFIYSFNGAGGSVVQSGTVQDWSCITRASSSTGMACVYGGKIYFTNNTLSTLSILAASPTANWTGIASLDSTTYIACATGEGIYVSTNAGTAWTATNAPTDTWSCISISLSSTPAFAATSSGKLYYSDTTTRTTWTLVSNIPAGLSFTSISDFDNAVWVATSSGTVYYVTSASGAAVWTPLPVSGHYVTTFQYNFSNGPAVANSNGFIHTCRPSTNSTVLSNWNLGSTSGNWSCVAYVPIISGGAGVVVGGQNTGGLYISSTPPASITADFTLSVNAGSALSVSGSSFGINTARNGPITLGASGGYTTDVAINAASTNPSITTIGNTNSGGNIIVATRNSSSITLNTGATGTGAGASSNAINLTSKFITMQSHTGTSIRQPLIQRGSNAISGSTGSNSGAVFTAYGAAPAVQITMLDTLGLTTYSLSNVTTSNFTVIWNGTGTPTAYYWTTYGN